jgi:outer membrane protein assembly factor BamB
VRRRWRALGLVLVLLAGSLLVLVVTDRGHDPLWSARAAPAGGAIDQAVVGPHGSVVYALVRENGNITSLEARSGASGALLWASPMSATRALLAASTGTVAVATDFPRAFLTIYGDDGSPRFQTALEGNPRALEADGSTVALALQAPGNPVFLFQDAQLARTLHYARSVDSLDLRAGRLAVGTGDGELQVVATNGTELLNVTLATSVRSVRLDADASSVVVGGAALAPGDLSGTLAMLDVDAVSPMRWSHATSAAVSLVEIDDAGLLVLAVQDTLPLHSIAVYDGGTGALRWTRPADGNVAVDDAGDHAGASLSPDGARVVVATLRGAVTSYVATTGRPEWSFQSEGSSVVAFARAAPDRLLADGSLTPNGPYDSLFLFSATQEPLRGRLLDMAVLLVLLAVIVASAVLGIGYWRVRRSY